MESEIKTFANTRAVVSHLSKYISGKTLDYGAGNAKYRDLITPRTSEYITFDMISGEKIDVVGDAHQPPFEDNSFNTIVSTQMLEHVEKPWVVVEQFKRILKPEGVCVLTAPFLVPYHADPHDFFRYTKEGLESLFKNNGFTIIESGRYGNTATVLTEMMHFSHFSHYRKHSEKKQVWRGRIMRRIKSFAFFLDSVFKNQAVYANAYVVARKK